MDHVCVWRLFGYTGIKMFGSSEEEEFSPEENWAYRFMKKFMRTTDEEPNGRFIIVKHKRPISPG